MMIIKYDESQRFCQFVKFKVSIIPDSYMVRKPVAYVRTYVVYC